MANNIAVAIPTYNEKDNIVGMIDSLNSLELAIDIIVIDDNSPDGTGDAIESARRSRPNVDVIHRERKEGLGPAYVAAFRQILKKGTYDFVVQMDADFSHNPKDVVRLLDAAKHCDVVVGSRYVKNGGVSREWAAFRKFVSILGNLYARFITGLRVRDCTSGFKCYRRRALGAMDLDTIFLNGYGFQVQILYELNKKGALMREIPIFFEERTKGSSKMSVSIVIEAFFSLILLRLRDIFKK